MRWQQCASERRFRMSSTLCTLSSCTYITVVMHCIINPMSLWFIARTAYVASRMTIKVGLSVSLVPITPFREYAS